MFDENLARIRTHRNNIYRYRRLLRTELSDLERGFTVARDAGAVALRFQVEFQALCQMIFVLDDEDMGRGAHTVAPRSNLPPGVRMRGSCR